MKLLLCLSAIVQAALPAFINGEYLVPKPHVKVLSPRGFRVSIPHVDGMELFAFHGNVNKPMDGLEAGQFSRDIVTRKKNKWVFEDRSTKLQPGDVIYYWLFVINRRLGYRYDNGEFVVKGISTTRIELPFSNQLPSETENDEKNTSENDSSCRCQLHHYIVKEIEDLAEEVKKLRENSSVLQKLLEKSQFVSLEMKFAGILPPYDDAAYTAQVIIDEKLKLKVPVINATRNADSSITFRLANLDDKVTVIKVAKEELSGSKIKLIY